MDKQTALQAIYDAIGVGDVDAVTSTIKNFMDADAGNYFTLNELQGFANDLPVSIGSAQVALLYSGELNTPSYKLAQSIAANSGGAVAIVDNTKAGILLNNEDFYDAVSRSLSFNSDPALDGMIAEQYIWGINSPSNYTEGLIDQVSYNFVKENDLPTRAITGTATDAGVWSRTEIQAFLDSNAPDIEGIPRTVVSTIYQDAYTEKFNAVGDVDLANEHALKQTQLVIKAKSLENIQGLEWEINGGEVVKVYDGGTGNWSNVAGIESGSVPAGSSYTKLEANIDVTALDDQLKLDYQQGAARYLKYVDDVVKIADHPLLTALEFSLVATTAITLSSQAEAQEIQGNYAQAAVLREQAYEELATYGGNFVGGFVAGLYGASAGASAAAAATSFLNIAGPAGTLTNAVLTVVGGIAGAIVGGEAVESSVREIVQNVETLTTQEGLQNLVDDYAWAVQNPSSLLSYIVEGLKETIYEATGVAELKPSSMPDYDELTEGGDVTYKSSSTDDTHQIVTNTGSITIYGDGTGKIFYNNFDAGKTYALTINGNGELELSYSQNILASRSFTLFHELDVEDRQALSEFVQLVNADHGLIEAFIATLPTTAAQNLEAALSSLSGGLFETVDQILPSISGFVAVDSPIPTNVAVDESTIPHADGLDGTVGGGPRLQTYDVSTNYSNSDLFYLLKNGAADTRTKAFGSLYDSALDYDQIITVGGVITAQIEGGGYIRYSTDQNGRVSVAIYEDGSDFNVDRPVGFLIDDPANGFQVVRTDSANGNDPLVSVLAEDSQLGKLALTQLKIADQHYASLQGVIGDEIATFIANKLADGNVLENLLYSSALKAVSQNFDVFTGMLADGIPANEAVGAFSGDSVMDSNGDLYVNNDILTDSFVKFVGAAEFAIAGFLVGEVAEAVDLSGIGGGIITTAGTAVTVELVSETFDVVFESLDGAVLNNLFDGSFDFDIKGIDIANALAAFVGRTVAGEIISPENEVAGVLGSLGAAAASYVAGVSAAAGSSIASIQAALQLGTAFGPVGIAIGAFVGTIAGTVFGNLFGSDEPEPATWAQAHYDTETKQYVIGANWAVDGADEALSLSMAQSVINGVNSIIEASAGKLRTGQAALKIQIGWVEGEYMVSVGGSSATKYSAPSNMIMDTAFKILEGFDLVGGHAVVMRAWHNSDATNIHELKEDIEVAEAFQSYLANPTAILALMMDQPDSELAQSWAAILQRAAELELHLPHEKDLEGGWGEVLAAQGVDPELIPDLDGDTIVLTDPVTGEETVIHHVIGPGYDIVRIEGTDGDDIIQVNVDGPSITYIDAGAGDDQVTGSEEDDIIVGGAGDDTIDGLGGNDWIHGGDGNDTIDGGTGDDMLVGGFDNDTLFGGEDADHIYGSYGNDIMYGDGGQNYLFGGAGNDVIHSESLGGDQNYIYDGMADYVYGGEGDDILHAYNHDYLLGGSGNDTYVMNDGYGDNIIRIERTEGHDIVEVGIIATSSRIEFSRNISFSEMFFQKNGNDLKILILGEDQSVTINDYFTLVDSSLSIRTFDSWFIANAAGGNKQTISQLVAIDASLSEQPSGQYNVLSDSALAQREALYDFHDIWTLTGGNPSITATYGTTGNDSVNTIGSFYAGRAGDDTIVMTSNNNDDIYGDSGNDTIYAGNGVDYIVGGLGDDLIFGQSGDDKIFGGHGDDKIGGGAGSDRIFGGAGNDFINGEEGDDFVEGGDGEDYIVFESGHNTAFGDAGNDILTGGVNDDLLNGGAGTDTIDGKEGDDILNGDDDDDVIDGGEGDDTASGGSGDDTLVGGAGNDTLYGNDGDDYFKYDYARNAGFTDFVYGGNGEDTLSLFLTSSDFAQNSAISTDILGLFDFINERKDSLIYDELSYSIDSAALTVSGIENIEIYIDGLLQAEFYGVTFSDLNVANGTPSGETLYGTNESDLVYAGSGADTIYAGQGSDFLYADDGNDIIFGEDGNDQLYGGIGNDVLNGGSGSDHYIFQLGDGIDTVFDESGEDTIYIGNSLAKEQVKVVYSGLNATISYLNGSGDVITLQNQLDTSSTNEIEYLTFADGTTWSLYSQLILTNSTGVNSLFGSHKNDFFATGNGNDYQYGYAGDDLFYGGAGNDQLNGGDGDDIFLVRAGTDHHDGGDGIDTAWFAQGYVNGVEYSGNPGAVNLNLANHIIYTDGKGGTNNHTIINVENVVSGGNHDTIIGDDENNVLKTGAGNDYVSGGGGDDTLIGELGSDALSGGTGADTFVFDASDLGSYVDTVSDFDLLEGDKLDISDLLTGYDPLSDAIADFVQITDSGSNSILSIDADGGADNFIQIATLTGVTGLTDEEALETSGNLITA